MKVGIIYLSGTGSTAKFAEEIALGFREAGHEVELHRFEKCNPQTVEKFEILGLGCPTYSYAAPPIFLGFLKTLPNRQFPFFAFCTCGGQPANTTWDIYNVMKTKGVFIGDIIGKGPNNIRAWRPKLTQPKLLDGIRTEDMARARDFVHVIEGNYKLVVTKGQAIKKPWFSRIAWLWKFVFARPWQMAWLEGKRRVNLQVCNRCGLCATRICVSGAITLAADKIPQINQAKCIGCGGCINLCPVTAIDSPKNYNRQPYKVYQSSVLNPPK